VKAFVKSRKLIGENERQTCVKRAFQHSSDHFSRVDIYTLHTFRPARKISELIYKIPGQDRGKNLIETRSVQRAKKGKMF
jgi:hypothetical protein